MISMEADTVARPFCSGSSAKGRLCLKFGFCSLSLGSIVQSVGHSVHL